MSIKMIFYVHKASCNYLSYYCAQIQSFRATAESNLSKCLVTQSWTTCVLSA